MSRRGSRKPTTLQALRYVCTEGKHDKNAGFAQCWVKQAQEGKLHLNVKILFVHKTRFDWNRYAQTDEEGHYT